MFHAPKTGLAQSAGTTLAAVVALISTLTVLGARRLWHLLSALRARLAKDFNERDPYDTW